MSTLGSLGTYTTCLGRVAVGKIISLAGNERGERQISVTDTLGTRSVGKTAYCSVSSDLRFLHF